VRQPSQSSRLFEDGLEHLREVGSSFDVHGSYELLPPGYRWVIPSPILCADLVRGLKARETIHISRSRSFLKMAASIVQLVLSSVTIYRSRGSQLDRYGYAAFGLTVIPYTFMSLVNFIYIGAVGEYAALTILQTPTMQEANDRLGGQICGEVGILTPANPTDPTHEGSEQDTTDIQEVDAVDELLAKAKDATGEKTVVSLWLEEPDILCVKKRDHTQIRKFHLIEDGKPTLLFDVHPIASDLRVHEPNHDYKDTILPNIGVHEVLKERFNRANRLHKLSLTIKGIIVVAAPLLAVILPPVLIAIWTGYHRGQSSPFRRVVMVSWLTFNQVAVLTAQLDLLAKYKSAWTYKSTLQDNFSLGWLRESAEGAQASDINESGITQESTTGNGDMNACQAFLNLCGTVVLGLVLVVLGLVLFFVNLGMSVAVLGLPIAGFVEVGKMLKEFGTCTIDS